MLQYSIAPAFNIQALQRFSTPQSTPSIKKFLWRLIMVPGDRIEQLTEGFSDLIFENLNMLQLQAVDSI